MWNISGKGREKGKEDEMGNMRKEHQEKQKKRKTEVEEAGKEEKWNKVKKEEKQRIVAKCNRVLWSLYLIIWTYFSIIRR